MTQDVDGLYTVGIVNMPVHTGTVAKGLSELKALYLVTACNEHDTLKDKAELLDEALVWADLCRQLLFQCGDSAFPRTKRGIEKINTLLSKAKALG